MSKKFIGMMVGLFILAVGAFFLTLHWGSEVPLAGNAPSVPGTPAVGAPKITSVTLTVTTSKKGNTLVVAWENLPDNTAALDIFRSIKGKGDWSLWKTIAIAPGDLAGGTAGIDIGGATFSTYSFYIEAMTGGGSSAGEGAGVSSSTSSGNVLWASTITDAPVATSTPSSTLPAPGQGSQNPPPPIAPTSTPTSTPSLPPASQTSTPSSSASSSNPGNTGTPTPSGTPYYTPQLQISGYGTWQGGSFWVRHVDQKIEIGWQDLPPIADGIVVLRSPDEDGPWDVILTQGYPNATSSYSIQLVDDTLGSPYYYELNAFAGSSVSSTIATYGPVYLLPVGQ